MKKLSALTLLSASLTMLGGGCDSLKPSAAVPQWEQARADYRARTDPATLQAEDWFWQMFAILGESLAGAY